MPNQECSYGGYCGVEVGPNMVCQDGYWRYAYNTVSCLIPQCGVPEVDASDGGVDDGPGKDADGSSCGLPGGYCPSACIAMGGTCVTDVGVCPLVLNTQFDCGGSGLCCLQ